ncbi:MAG: SLC13/DASS family transporter [Deltaproteobacteria bacterium]|nr:SLC13/DASS family transporter [Deltaproteobacteria bacterium]MBW2533831.1 SLC13/DASS family transporter [Deltaproteobacteria bacterium]
MPAWRIGALIAGPLVCLVPLLVDAPTALGGEAWRLCGLAGWMVVWWLTEAIPVPATALLPIVGMPLLGIGKEGGVTASYAHPLIFLFLGGFLIAGAMQRSGLHERVALFIVWAVGRNARSLVGGFMIACALLSMWISNTATAVMMFPVGLSVIGVVAKETDRHTARRFGVALMLAIAYSCSIGGIATLIGTPPNTLLAAFLADSYGYQLSFASWMAIGLPFCLVLLPLTWLWLTRVGFPAGGLRLSHAREDMIRRLRDLGPMSRGERIVGIGFLIAAVGWIVRPLIVKLTGVPISDTTVAMSVGLAMFVVPVSLETGRFALDWATARNLRWGVLLLFGGGLALAGAFKSTGLAEAIGRAFAGFAGTNVWLTAAAMAATVLFLTELTSNTATTATFLPIVAAIAIGWGENPLLFVVPVAIAASGAFMLPVATPPNAVAFGYPHLRVRDMARTGAVLNLLCVVLVVLVDFVLCRWVLGAEPGVLPPWVR